AETEEICTSINFFTAGLLRRHVGNGAHGNAGAGKIFIDDIDGVHCGHSYRRGKALSSRGELGQAEVQNFGFATLGYEYVGRLDVPMNDVLRVRGVEAVGNLNSEIQQVVQR